jgi:hypothetical protein
MEKATVLPDRESTVFLLRRIIVLSGGYQIIIEIFFE